MKAVRVLLAAVVVAVVWTAGGVPTYAVACTAGQECHQYAGQWMLTASPPSTAELVATTASVASATRVATLPAPAQRLAYDAAHSAIWFVTMESGSPTTLNRVDAGTGTIQTFPLPATDYNGYTTTLAVTPSGAVWVGLPYNVVRWDPETSAVTAFALTEHADGELPSAFDINQPLAGTWVSAVTASGEDAIISRLNVPFLFAVSPTGATRVMAKVPDAFAGSRQLVSDRSGTIFALPGYLADSLKNDVLGVTPAGSLVDTGIAAATGLSQSDELPLVDSVAPVTGSTTSDPARVEVAGVSETVRTMTRRFGSVTAAFDPTQNRVVRVTDSGTDALTLDTATGPAGRAGAQVSATEDVKDLVVTQDGSVWILRHGGLSLVRLLPR